MTECEERLLKVIFNKDRERNNIHLFLKSTGETLYHDIKDMFVLSGVYNVQKGQLFLAADEDTSETGERGFCTPLTDIGFEFYENPLTLKQVSEIVRRTKGGEEECKKDVKEDD